MKILVLNCGSSSIKYKLYNMDDNSVLAAGGVERIGLDEAFIKITLPNGEKKKIMHDMPDHKEGVNFVFQCLLDPEFGAIKSLSEIDAVGHRIVQGGDLFEKSVIVDKSVEDGIESLCDLAPVHNAGHLKGLRAVDKLMPEVPQVCVFDNAFHSTMPDYAYLYAVPYELYEKYHVRRYGFHGTSHRYVSQRVCEFLGRDIKTQRIITCHIGNGASVSAVKFGKKPQEMADFLNKESGVLGITGISSDMREVESAAAEGNKRAQLALKMYNYRIKKYIGAYAAAMGGVDIIVWTAGVGENQIGTRLEACSGLEFLGVEMDAEANKVRGEEAIISKPESKVTVCVIPTDEELMIAKDTMALLQK